jgi:hypothetical protein
VSSAFLEQALALAGAPLAVLVLHRRHMHHAADPRFAPQIGEEHPHQLLQVDAIGLGASRAPIHLDARRIDHMTDHALLR